MPIPVQWRAKQTTTTSGTGTVTLAVADARFRSFAAAIGAAARVHYQIDLPGSSEWEEGIGTFNGASPGTLTRTTVLANHLGTTSLVSFSAGVKDVILLGVPGQRRRIAITGNTTAALSHLGGTYNLTGSTGATLTLPALSGVPQDAGYTIINSGTAGAALVIDGSGSELVGAATTLPILPGESVEIWSDGTVWLTSIVPALALVRTQAVTGTPSVLDFALPVADAVYEAVFRHVNMTSDGQLGLRVSSDGGSNFDAGGSDYGRAYDFNDGASSENKGSNVADQILLTDNGAAAGARAGTFMFYTGTASRAFRVWGGQSSFANVGSTLLQGGTFQGSRAANAAMNAIRFLPGSTMTAGVFSLYLRRG